MTPTPTDPTLVAAVLREVAECSDKFDRKSAKDGRPLSSFLVGRAIQLERAGTEGGVALFSGTLCEDCPPVGYPTDKTRCEPCPRRTPTAPSAPHQWAWVKGKGYQACSVCTLIRLPSGRYDNEECDGRPPTDDKPAPSAPAPWDAEQHIQGLYAQGALDYRSSDHHDDLVGLAKYTYSEGHAAGVGARVPLPEEMPEWFWILMGSHTRTFDAVATWKALRAKLGGAT